MRVKREEGGTTANAGSVEKESPPSVWWNIGPRTFSRQNMWKQTRAVEPALTGTQDGRWFQLSLPRLIISNKITGLLTTRQIFASWGSGALGSMGWGCPSVYRIMSTAATGDPELHIVCYYLRSIREEPITYVSLPSKVLCQHMSTLLDQHLKPVLCSLKCSFVLYVIMFLLHHDNRYKHCFCLCPYRTLLHGVDLR